MMNNKEQFASYIDGLIAEKINEKNGLESVRDEKIATANREFEQSATSVQDELNFLFEQKSVLFPSEPETTENTEVVEEVQG